MARSTRSEQGGVASLLRRAGRRLLQSIVDVKWFYFYETDLTGELPDWQARIPIDIQVASESDLQTHAALLEENRLSRAEFTRRLACGDHCLLATSAGEPAFYQWIAYRSVWIPEIGATLLLEPGDCYNYHSRAFMKWRGQEIFPAVLSYANRHERSLGMRREIYYVTMSNASSLRVMEKLGCRRTKTVWSIRLFSLPWPIVCWWPRAGSPGFRAGRHADE